MTQNFKVIQKHSPRNPKHLRKIHITIMKNTAWKSAFANVLQLNHFQMSEHIHIPRTSKHHFLLQSIFMSFYIFPSVTLHMEHHCCSTPKFFSTLVARMKRPVKVSACQYFFNYYTPLAGPTSCVSLQVFPEVVLPSEYFPTKVAGEDGFGRAKAVSLLCVLLPPSPVAKLFPTRGTDRPLLSGLLHHKSVSVQVPVV